MKPTHVALASLAALSLACTTPASSRDAARPDAPACADVPRLDATVEPAASIARELFHRAFRRDRPRYQCCYESLLSRAPDAHGRVVVTVSFEENLATAASMRDAEESMKADDAFETCVVSVAERMEIELGQKQARVDAAPGAPRAAPGETSPPNDSGPRPARRITVSYPLHFDLEMAGL